MTTIHGTTFSPVTVVPAEGVRVGFVVCGTCSAAVLLDPREATDPVEAHARWHLDLRNGLPR